MIGTQLLACLALCVTVLTACGPSEQRKAELAEQKRVDCLDKLCQGDVEPQHAATEVALKLNGEWFIGPRKYFTTGKNGGGFYWPSRHPTYAGGEYPEAQQDFPSKAIEIFLTGRQRWPDPKIVAPWENGSWEKRFAALQKGGLRMERGQLRPGLERVRFFDAQGQYRREYFLATQENLPRGNSLPAIACDLYPDSAPKALPWCTGGFFWQEDVYADFRLHAKHANDWPEIYLEITRVLQLLRKA